MEQTKELWEIFKTEKYEIVLGTTDFDEIEKCSEVKKEILYDYLSRINYEVVETTEEITKLANEIIEQGILWYKNNSISQKIYYNRYISTKFIIERRRWRWVI